MKRAGQLAIVQPTDLAQQYATRINRAMTTVVDGIFEMGRAFAEAKEKLHHGGWLRMFRDHPERVAKPVWCAQSTARMLMAIAAHPILADRHHGNDLPPHWRTLYELTKVEAPRLLEAIRRGDVHPDMQRRHVRKLRAPTSDPPMAENFREPPPTPGQRLLRALIGHLQREWPALEHADRALVIADLRRYLNDVEARANDDE
jgi:hypothetical protein